MESSIFEVQVTDNGYLSPVGDGGYGHALKNLHSTLGLAKELSDEGTLDADTANQVAVSCISTFTLEKLLNNPNAMSKFAPLVQAEIRARSIGIT